LDEYIKAAGIGEDGKSPLFRSALGRTGVLNGEAMHRIDAYRMIQRRAAELGMKGTIGCHHLPGDRDHHLSRSRWHARKRPGAGGARKTAHDQVF
jgi:hypothetical protein